MTIPTYDFPLTENPINELLSWNHNELEKVQEDIECALHQIDPILNGVPEISEWYREHIEEGSNVCAGLNLTDYIENPLPCIKIIEIPVTKNLIFPGANLALSCVLKGKTLGSCITASQVTLSDGIDAQEEWELILRSHIPHVPKGNRVLVNSFMIAHTCRVIHNRKIAEKILRDYMELY